MFVSTSSSLATKVPLGDGLPLETLFKNTIGIDGFGSRRQQYLERKLTIPVAFFETGKYGSSFAPKDGKVWNGICVE